MINRNIQVAQSKRTAFAKLAGAFPAVVLSSIAALAKLFGYFNTDWTIVCFPLLLFIGHTVLFRIVYRAATLALIDVDTAIALYEETHENDPPVGVKDKETHDA